MDKIWLNQYPNGVPDTIDPNKYHSLSDLFLKSCGKYSDKPAFTNMGVTVDYKQLEKQTRYFAAYLQIELGLKKGDRIAIMLPNVLQYPIVMFAALRAGLVVVNVNPLYTSRELQHQLIDSGAKALVVLENFAATVQAFKDEGKGSGKLEHIIVAKISDVFSAPKSYIVDFVVKYIKKMVPKWEINGYKTFKDAFNVGKSLYDQYKDASLEKNDIAYLQYTGGTTGISKGAIISHGNMLANIEQATAWIKNYTVVGGEVIITALPLYHIFSLMANCWTFMGLGALNVLITNPRDVVGFVKILRKYKFTSITGVNTLFKALLNNKGFRSLNFSHLKITLGGGMAIQQTVADRWKQVTGKRITEAYGLTETSPAVCINLISKKEETSKEEKINIGGVGLALPSTEISVRDDNGHEVNIGNIGELWVRGPQVMRGYWQQKEETNKVLKEDGWLATGDMAIVDEEGFVKIVDRKKDMIIISGFNVYPNEIEDIIMELDGVIDVAVIGVYNDNGCEKIKAFIVLDKNGDKEYNEEFILKYCRQNLTAYKVPKVIEFRNTLPKTNVGKILKRALR